ncbi:hypothetical protein [Glaciimonas sp. PAMC28666]|uniref:DUF6932 family protein n=1 Tax=Glaciimonas sp. PAMC28666 TaxID=2807626 RepID=UPI0019664393|nr:hypothetical protein [Glaciimonas sp. PAMC28666]QRX83252.1 hypothetical protein JQN73_02950 [Glaciimonas sp. PAMC28666]
MRKIDFPSLYSPGIHEQTMQQVEGIAVKPFSADIRRQEVWRRFRLLHDTVTAIVPRCEWYINGSILTTKVGPDDVDASVFIRQSVLSAMSAKERDYLKTLRDRDSTKLRYLTDFFIESADDPNRRMYWRGVFGFCHDSITAKGFVSVQYG